MSKLTFYRQKRADGGIRTGIEINGETAFAQFDEGRDDRDPALLWYIDVRCEGRTPTDSDQAREWLLEHGDTIQNGLKDAAAKIRAGIDPDVWPFQFKLPARRNGAAITIVCSCMNRVASRELTRAFGEIAAKWDAIIDGLAVAPAER